MQYTALVSGEHIEVSLDRTGSRIEATIAGRTYLLEGMAVQAGVYWLNYQGQSFEVTVLDDGGVYTVSIGGHRLGVELLDPRTALRRADHSRHDGVVEVRAPMPGKIVRVLAAQDAAVAAGQGIVVMEAMKMQNELKSPKDGVIRELKVVEGSAVGSGDLIAIVE
jgi:acetyl/propionyl-CoA carboxylase alpha subunit